MLLRDGADMFNNYLYNADKSKETIKGYKQELSYLEAYLAKKYNCDTYIEDIKAADIEDFLLYLKDVRGWEPISRSRNFYVLRSFFNWAYKKELVNRNISLSVEPIKLQQKEREYLTDDEVYKLLEAIHHELVNLITRTLYLTGMRISECLSLTLDNVDLDRGLIHVIAGKGNKDRLIPISDKLSPYLIKYVEEERPNLPTDQFFITARTGSISGRYVNRIIVEAAKGLGWNKEVTCHILRHSFATRLVQQDVGLVEVQKLLGHSSLKVTSVYTHSNTEKLSAAVNAM